MIFYMVFITFNSCKFAMHVSEMAEEIYEHYGMVEILRDNAGVAKGKPTH